ncbi:hypothetical protein I4641_02370 [Waterburya agarophytonicola K14]|uniref:Uncharacterized protein n=1 Tax=Waterburya agarophytonicola KI4 TaxID=2874699 RepID=A0A964FE73_9CYAN|nr:hypothetical protein [Waterburya agarophytonicola]MCC0175826.1 hypothetical protein [Waterburya agarophytonicola KI4]
MSLKQNKSKSALGNNPLSDLSSSSLGIFNRTDKIDNSQESRIKNQNSDFQESRIKNKESSFSPLSDRDLDKEKVNLRLPLELNDWLDATVKRSKRLHGHKIKKETLVHAALLFFHHLPLDWDSIQSIDDLQLRLHRLSSILNQDS